MNSYKVNVGYTSAGRPRNLYFDSQDKASAFCNDVFARTGVVLSIVKTPKRITAYEIINHGADHSQYFQGCGVSHTSFEHVATGVSVNAKEAYEDAIEGIAQMGYDVSTLPTRPRGIRQTDAVRDSEETDNEVHYYVSIRVR